MLRSSIHRISAVAVVISAVSLVTPAMAVDTSFAQYRSSIKTFSTTDKDSTFNIAETANATFSFLASNLSSTIADVQAIMSLKASAPNTDFSSGLVGPKVFLNTSGLNGSYTFTSTKAYTVGHTFFAKGSNLLTVAFTNADLYGPLHSLDATLAGQNSANSTVTYTSDFMDFTNVLGTDFSVSLGAVNPSLSGTQYFNAFTATPTGTFSSDPAPLSVAVVPEPTTWALMLAGLGAIGFALRRNSRRNLQTA